MSQNTVWKYNDNEFVIDLADADTFERYWDACEKLGQREDELKNSESDRGFIRSEMWHRMSGFLRQKRTVRYWAERQHFLSAMQSNI